MTRAELARERAQDQADLLDDLLASVEKVAMALKYGLLDLRRDGRPSDLMPVQLRAKRQAGRLQSLADTIERGIAEPVVVSTLEAAE